MGELACEPRLSASGFAYEDRDTAFASLGSVEKRAEWRGLVLQAEEGKRRLGNERAGERGTSWRWLGAGGVEQAILVEDALLEVAELGTGLEAELGERGVCVAICGERFRLTPRPV